MKESDWKTFKKIKAKAIEDFCVQALTEFETTIHEGEYSAHETYTLLYKLVNNRDRQMALLFDGQSRSKAHIQLLAIRGEGFADEAFLTELSEEFLKQTDPKQVNW